MAIEITDHAVQRFHERGYLPTGTPDELARTNAEVRAVAAHGVTIATIATSRRPDRKRPQRRVGMVAGRPTVVWLQHDRGVRVATVYPAGRRTRQQAVRRIYARAGWTPPLAA